MIVQTKTEDTDSLVGTSSLAELQEYNPSYLVMDIEQKTKGVISVKNHDVIGISVEFTGFAGKLYWVNQ